MGSDKWSIITSAEEKAGALTWVMFYTVMTGAPSDSGQRRCNKKKTFSAVVAANVTETTGRLHSSCSVRASVGQSWLGSVQKANNILARVLAHNCISCSWIHMALCNPAEYHLFGFDSFYIAVFPDCYIMCSGQDIAWMFFCFFSKALLANYWLKNKVSLKEQF